MSQPIFETSVVIRPELAPDFEQDLQRQMQTDVDKATAKLKVNIGKDVSQSQANRQAIDVQSQMANLGPLIKAVGPGAATGGIESTRRNLIELERLAKIYPELAIGAAQMRQQFNLLTQAEVKNAVATEQVAVANRRAERTQLATGLRSNLLNLVRGAEGGAGIGQLASFGLKAGAVGLAVTAAYQAVSQLRQGLQVTGAEAATTEGRFRNLGASLLGGDVIGAFKAARAEFSLTEGALESLQAQIAKGDSSNLEKLATAASVFGSDKLRGQLQQAQFQVRGNLRSDAQQQALLTPGLKDDLREAKRAEAEARIGIRVYQEGTEKYSKAFVGYVAAVKARRQVQEQIEKDSSPLARDATRDAQFRLNLARAQQTKGTGNDKAILEGRRDYLKKQIANLEDEGATTAEAKSRLTSLYGQLESTTGEITDLAKNSLADRQAKLQEQISLQQTGLQIQEANARNDSQEIVALRAQQTLASKLSDDKRLDAQARAGYALQAAQLDKQVFGINQAAAREAAAAAKQAAEERERVRKEALAKMKAAREEKKQLGELRLSNAESAAGLTKRTSDDKKAIQRSIAYYKGLAKNTQGLEREQARTQLISARSRLAGLTPTGQQGATTAEFFAKAAQQFGEFGSNIAGRGGVLSGQDARGQFAGLALQGGLAGKILDALTKTAAPQLTEAQKHTSLLRLISIRVGRFDRPGPIDDDVTINRTRAKAVFMGGI